MFTIRKVFKFEAAHRLIGAYSKDCTYIHGHSYVVEVFLRATQLNGDGMVLDFGELKKCVGHFIKAWDHRIILAMEDDLAELNLVKVDFNPTAEEMAHYLFDVMKHDLKRVLDGKEPWLWKVRVHETATGWAEYEEE